jgi:hypothetical protein
MIEWDSTSMTSYDDIDPLMDIYDEQIIQEQYEILPYDALPIIEDLPVLFVFDTIIREELENEHIEETEREEFETLEELEEWFEEELAEVEENLEERLADTNEEIYEEETHEEETHEEVYEEIEELFAEEDESRPTNEIKSSVRLSALSVVASTLRTAGQSNSSSYASYSNTSSSITSSGSNSISTSNSPSMSDQITSSNMQTNQVLSMSNGGTGNVSVFVTPMPNVDNNPQIVMAEVQVQDMQGDIDTAVSGVMTASEADQVAEKIIAQNIEAQQDQAAEEQEETGEYGDQSTLVAYLGYVPGFNSYRDAQIPNQQTWYEPRSIYADASIADNTQAFYQLAGTSLNTLGEMINSQPTL